MLGSIGTEATPQEALTKALAALTGMAAAAAETEPAAMTSTDSLLMMAAINQANPATPSMEAFDFPVTRSPQNMATASLPPTIPSSNMAAASFPAQMTPKMATPIDMQQMSPVVAEQSVADLATDSDSEVEGEFVLESEEEEEEEVTKDVSTDTGHSMTQQEAAACGSSDAEPLADVCARQAIKRRQQRTQCRKH